MVLTDTEKKCNICGKVFENSNKLNQHKLESHKDKNKNIKTKSSSSSRFKATGIAAVIAVIIIAAVYFSENQNQTPSANAIDGVNCDPTEAVTYHIHAHLDMIVDNKFVTIPQGIGIKPNECLYWLHTHTPDGIIHIESPTARIFTLGQIIHVWDATPGISTTFEKLTNNDANLKVFVNGNEVKESFDKIALSAHDEIVIISGAVPPSFPSSYDFGGL